MAKIEDYLKVNASNFASYVEKADIVDILTAGQDISKTRAHSLRSAIETAVESFDDETACEYPELYPQWESGIEYVVGQRINRDGQIYTVLQDHTSQADWAPEDAPSLFAKALTSDTEILQWEQPDSTNAYMTGDKVIFNGKIYESLIDNNVWSPEAYPAGWKEVTE